MRLGMAHRSDQVKIGKHAIGAGNPVFVIAEIGSNHNGHLETAKRYIETVGALGAHCAKFQLYREDKLYPGQTTPGAIPDHWLPHLKRACRNAGVEFMCSVFCEETLDSYMQVRPTAIKIASPESHNHALLRAAGATGVPVVVATGASTYRDVYATAQALDGARWVLLHCTSAYPAPDAEANLAVIQELAAMYEGIPVGLSDHTTHGPAPALAVALGASVVEKHLTFNRSLPGPDHSFALEPAEFRQMCQDVQRAAAMLGDGQKRVTVSEDAKDRRQAA